MVILSISTIPLNPNLGSGQTRLHWTNGLKKSGHTVDVLEPKNFEFLPKLKKGKRYRMAIGILITVRKIFKKKQYNLVEFYGDEYWLLLLWLKKVKKNKILTVAHSDGVELYAIEKQKLFWNEGKRTANWIMKHIDYFIPKTTFTLADKLVCGCAEESNYMIEKKFFLPSDAVSIAPGIRDSFHQLEFKAIKEKIIIYIGSWIKRKGVELIPPVINKILLEKTDYKFYIIGSGIPGELLLDEFADAVKAQIKVFDKVNETELQQLALAASIFFFPSYYEGFGLCVPEAMSCSCACIITPTGIGCELLPDNEAIICNFNDIPVMINGIYNLINNEAKRQEIAFNGWKKTKIYKWEDEVKKLETTYLKWCNE